MIETKDWCKICADCQEGNPPEDCEYYGEPRGCNAPTYGGPPPRYYEELREENKRLRAALKPVLECKVLSAMTAEVRPGRGEYCATIIEKVQHIYNDGEAKQKKGDAK